MNKKSGFENNKNYGRVISLIRKWAHNQSFQVIIEELDLAEAYPNGCIYISSEKQNTCTIEILFYFDYTDPDGNKEVYPSVICLSKYGDITNNQAGYDGHLLEDVLLQANIIRQNSEEDTFLQMLPLLLNAVAQGNVKQYFWRQPHLFEWNPNGLCSLTRFKIKDNYLYLKTGTFYQPYKPKYFRRRPIRIVSYKPWENGDILPQDPDNYYIADFRLLGSALVFFGLIIGVSLLTIRLRVNFSNFVSVSNLYLLSNIIAFFSLAITGIFINSKWWRHILWFFLPVSLIGLVAVPFGTYIYCYLFWIFWRFKSRFFPFYILYSKKKQKGGK